MNVDLTDELIQDVHGIWVDKSMQKVSYPEEGHEDCFALEDNSFWFKHRNNILKAVISRFPFVSNFADIGGGNGYQAKFIQDNFPGTKVFLVEPGYQGCLNGKKRGLKDVYNVIFQKFNFIDNEVRSVGLFDVLEHIENDVDFIAQLKSKLQKGSLIYMTLPCHMYLWSDVDDYGGHYRRYNKNRVEDLARKTGLELLFFSYFFSYMPLLTFLSRRIPYLIRGKRDNSGFWDKEGENHTPSKIFLLFFNFFHRLELWSIKKNKINHGGSCIAIFKI